MTTALLDRLTHHCDIIETGNDGGLERYDPSGPSIEDRSQVHKASRDCDISDVGHPEFVGTVRRHGLREIGQESGWEKGQVENQVGLVRERFFTPRLRFKTYDEMNA